MAQYQVAFSYASTRTDYVRDVASRVQRAGYRVFFDESQRAELYRKNLRDQLSAIYKEAPLSVLFLSSDYERSSWCKIERQAAQDLDGTVLVGRFDDSPVTGINANDWAARLNHVPAADFAAIIVTELRKLDVRPEDSGPSVGELEYGLGFGPAGFRVAYLPARGAPWQEHYDERPLEKLTLEIDRTPFELPQRYQAWEPARHGQNLPRCRLVSYSIGPEEMRLTLSRTSYEDYLRSGELIDFMRAPGSEKTLRAHFLTTLQRDRGYLEPFSELTNICGVGIFVITRDNKLVSTKHSDNSHVYPGRRTFAASGTMPWGAWPHPYTAVLQKAHDEIQHLVDPKKLKLFAFGVDARKLYFQFSFVEERTDVTFEELRTHYEQSRALSRNPPRALIPVFFTPESVCRSLVESCWEPAAEAALLALLENRFPGQVEASLAVHRSAWWRRALRDEWDHRASRPDLLADMSVRYDRDRLREASRDYVDHVMAFMSGHIEGKGVVEIGSGTGRISERLIDTVAPPLTCVELSPAMIVRHRERLGDRAKEVSYEEGFAQDVLRNRQYEVAICSLVLIHNVDPQGFQELLDALCRTHSEIFVFEDVRQGRQPGPATRLRRRDELIDAFRSRHFEVRAEDRHRLFDDEVLFLNLARRT